MLSIDVIDQLIKLDTHMLAKLKVLSDLSIDFVFLIYADCCRILSIVNYID